MLSSLLAWAVLPVPFAGTLAYIDPLSGSIILQVLAAGALAASFTAKRIWSRLATSLRTVLTRIRTR